MITTTLPASGGAALALPEGMTAAPDLADVLPPVKQRGKVRTFIRRHPTIAVGGTLVTLMLLMAILAPYLWTVDPTALAPAKRTREPSALYWFGMASGMGVPPAHDRARVVMQEIESMIKVDRNDLVKLFNNGLAVGKPAQKISS